MRNLDIDTSGAVGRKTGGSCIWRASGAVSAQTCESRPDDCQGCPVYTSLDKLAHRKQVKFFSQDYFDQCSVDACLVPGQSCPFAGPCMANWSRTNAPALRTLTLMGIGGLSIGANASLIQQKVRRNGLHADLLSRIFELRNLGKLGPEDKLSPADLDLRTTEEQFSLVAAASFVDCLETLNLSAFAERMFENNLLPRGLSASVSGARDSKELWNAFRAMQSLAVLNVLSAFDINVLCEMQASMASSRYPSLVMAQTALTIQRTLQAHTHRTPGLAPEMVERAAKLVSFAGSLMGKVYQGLTVTPSELAAAVIVTRGLGAVSEDGTAPAGRVLLDEVLRMAAAGPLDMVAVQPILAGIVASGLDPLPDERTAVSRAVLESFQARFRKFGDMRGDPASLLASVGADNLIREEDQFAALAGAQAPVAELDPALLGCEMPADRFYHRGHAWVQPGRDGFIRIGIDDLLAHLIGCVDTIEMPGQGKHLRRGKPALRLIRGRESVELCSPVNGEIMAVNQSIIDSPRILPTQPYGDGWLLTVRPTVSEDNVNELMFGRNAHDWQREETQRLGKMFRGKTATAADGARLAHDALAKLPGLRWSKVLRKFLKG